MTGMTNAKIIEPNKNTGLNGEVSKAGVLGETNDTRRRGIQRLI